MKGAGRTAEETVCVVDDDASIRAGLCDLLESAGVKTREFASAEAFLATWKPEMAGCLVLDVRLQGMSGMELQSKLVETGVALPVIIMTGHGDMPMVKKALKAGAVEFLIKPFQDDELLQAVEQAFAMDRARRASGDLVSLLHARAQKLTDRERQVMEMVTAGMTNKEIAEKLFLSLVTVKLHRGQVMRKMEAESLAELVKMSEKMRESGS